MAIVLKTSGKVTVKDAATKKWKDSQRGERLDSGDIVKTNENAFAAIMFTDDKTMLKVKDNSMVAIRGKRENNSVSKRIACSLGNFWLKVKKQQTEMIVETPSGVAAVKGTEFYGVVNEDGSTMIIAVEGLVQLINKFGEQFVKAGQTGTMSKNESPTVAQTDPSMTPTWGGEDEDDNELMLEFEDANGNKKHLKIKYH
ncbi:MAG: FecR family protein [Candidatus Zhuqueibacterota bacterium]